MNRQLIDQILAMLKQPPLNDREFGFLQMHADWTPQMCANMVVQGRAHAADPAHVDKVVVDLSAKRERSNDATDLLDEKGVFMQAVRSLRKKWHAESMNPDLGDRAADRLRWQMITLESLPNELQGFINDYKFSLDRQRKHG